MCTTTIHQLTNIYTAKKQTAKALSIIPKGMFCSCNCVRRYTDLHAKDFADWHNKIQMLKYLYEIFTGKPISNIEPAPAETDMIQYGGYLTPGEYQQKIEQLDISYARELEENNFNNICNVYIQTLNG
jgi:hypothetical protein